MFYNIINNIINKLLKSQKNKISYIIPTFYQKIFIVYKICKFHFAILMKFYIKQRWLKIMGIFWCWSLVILFLTKYSSKFNLVMYFWYTVFSSRMIYCMAINQISINFYNKEIQNSIKIKKSKGFRNKVRILS